MGKGFMEMEICLEVQQEIEEGRIPSSALGGVSISEVLTALRNEPGESKTLPYSKSTKWGLNYSNTLSFRCGWILVSFIFLHFLGR